MCYSAKAWEDYRKYVREFAADIGIDEFILLYGDRSRGAKVRIPKGMDAGFAEPKTDGEREVKALIDAWNSAEASRLEQELFKQRKRLADAGRILQAKTTKKALDDQRIASTKIEQILGWLADLRRTEPKPRDNRIYPQHYAPVMVWEDGRRVVKPMRYLCRPVGKPAFVKGKPFDVAFQGCYNARRDNLEGFWKGQFGVSHAIMVAEAFYENVWKHAAEGRALLPGEKEENAILEFRPNTGGPMYVACLWSRWTGPGEELLSFAAITDEPPAEIAAAGHDRCIIPIRRENIDAWLRADSNKLADAYAILDDRERPYYEHRMAA